MNRLSVLSSVFATALVALAALVITPTNSGAQVIGGGSANFGVFDVRGGFLPDPMTWNIVSGGPIQASNINGSCRGYISSQPDLIIRYANAASFIRFFFRANGGVNFAHIPCLNDGDAASALIAHLVRRELQGWI